MKADEFSERGGQQTVPSPLPTTAKWDEIEKVPPRLTEPPPPEDEMTEEYPALVMGCRYLMDGRVVEIHGMGGSRSSPRIGLHYVHPEAPSLGKDTMDLSMKVGGYYGNDGSAFWVRVTNHDGIIIYSNQSCTTRESARQEGIDAAARYRQKMKNNEQYREITETI